MSVLVFLNKKRILHVLFSFEIGGLENGVVNIINNTQDFFEHAVCCISKSGNSALRLNNRVKIFELNKKEGHDLKIIFKLIKVIKQFAPDVVHTRNWGATDGLLASKMSGVPVIHSEHGWSPDDPFGQNLKRRMLRRVMCNYFATHCIAVSPEIKKWMLSSVGVAPSKLTLIPNGVDTDIFCPVNKNKSKLKSLLQLSSRSILFGSVGRMDPIKNYDFLINVFSSVCASCNNVFLVLVGGGRELEKLKKYAGELGCSKNVLFLGERKDISKIMPFLDVFILPSKNEGMSNTILESMSSGVPAIASNVGGNELLIEHNESGMLFDVDSKASLLESINYYIYSPVKRMQHGENARVKAVDSFSLISMVRNYAKLYNRFCGPIA